jgi:hypothetical protein
MPDSASEALRALMHGKLPYRIAGLPPGIISADDYDVTDEALDLLAALPALIEVVEAAEGAYGVNSNCRELQAALASLHRALTEADHA